MLRVEYVQSTHTLAGCPTTGLPEVAFIGRSNVGKSSLINRLTGRRRLAYVSNKPGKTQSINHYLVNDAWYLVDLPGYGYARVSQAQRRTFEAMVWGYIHGRETLYNLFVLVDGRHEPLANDLEFVTRLGDAGVAFCVVLTKIDKISSRAVQERKDQWHRILGEQWDPVPPILACSAVTGDGCKEILDYIGSFIHA